jgi:predicted nucleotidyltransferase
MQHILSTVVEVLNNQKFDYLVIGGLAVNYYGFARVTTDIDFMVVAMDTDTVVEAMKKAGFVSYMVQSNVMFFKNPQDPVRVDLLRVDSDTMARLLESALSADIYGCQVKIPSLDNLMAMKLHSLNQSNMLRAKDMEDIVMLCIINKVDVETVLRPLACKFASEAIYRQIYAQVQGRKDRYKPSL